MPQHTKLHERQRHPFRKEHTTDVGRDESKGVSNAADYDILKKSSMLHERRLMDFVREVSLLDDLEREFEDWK